MSNETFYDRLLRERKELDEKIDKLEIFVKGEVYAGLDAEDQGLLSDQLCYMGCYSSVLTRRIERLTKPE